MDTNPNYKQELFEILKANKKIHYPLFTFFFITVVVSTIIISYNLDYFENHRIEMMIYLFVPPHLIFFTIILVTSNFSTHIKKKKDTLIMTQFQAPGLYLFYALSLYPIVFLQVILYPENVKNLLIIFIAMSLALIMIILLIRNAFSPIRIEINDNAVFYRTFRYVSNYESFKLLIKNIDNVKINKHIGKEGYGVIISTKSNDSKKKVDFGSKNNDLIRKEIMKRISKNTSE